ncbi:hypothetical protein GCM10010324_61020 [Streptomyces hiroshimensis]|uniref:Uncharacterized protein n=1 Tax=Streptomyces hiroshimensis TaxID=66424 RepID=A0ABQ2ZA04_9ACTN|nr:hypothetical protein GCM10010324_61020 [Streptomyces hiroshimensis]
MTPEPSLQAFHSGVPGGSLLPWSQLTFAFQRPEVPGFRGGRYALPRTLVWSKRHIRRSGAHGEIRGAPDGGTDVKE